MVVYGLYHASKHGQMILVKANKKDQYKF